MDLRLLPERAEVGYCYSEKMGGEDYLYLFVGEVQSVRSVRSTTMYSRVNITTDRECTCRTDASRRTYCLICMVLIGGVGATERVLVPVSDDNTAMWSDRPRSIPILRLEEAGGKARQAETGRSRV